MNRAYESVVLDLPGFRSASSCWKCSSSRASASARCAALLNRSLFFLFSSAKSSTRGRDAFAGSNILSPMPDTERTGFTREMRLRQMLRSLCKKKQMRIIVYWRSMGLTRLLPHASADGSSTPHLHLHLPLPLTCCIAEPYQDRL